MKRWLLALTAVALLAAAVSVLLLTTAGLRWVVGIATPGEVEYEDLDGRLIGPVSVTGLRWRQYDRELSIERATLDWTLSPLLSRHLHLRLVEADGIRWRSTSVPAAAPRPREPGLPRLPVTIGIDALRIGDARFEHDDFVFDIDSLRLSAGLDNEHYRVAGLDLQSPTLDLSGDAAVGVAAPHDIDAGLSWEARIGEDPIRITGTVRAQGDTDSLQLDANTADGLVSTLSGTARRLLSAPSFDGAIDVSEVDPRLSRLDDERLTLSLAVDATPGRLQLDGRVTAPSLLPKAVALKGAVGLDDEGIEIETLEAGIEDATVRLGLTGNLRRDLSALDVTMNWRDLAWPLSGTPTLASPVGRAVLSGTLENYALDLTATASTTGWPAAKVALRGTGTREQFDIASATVRPGDKTASQNERVVASGLIGWATMPTADLKFNARKLRLERLHPDLAGEVDADGRARLKMPAAGPEIDIGVHKLGGQLRGQPLGGSGAVAIVPGRIALRDLDLVVGNAAISASGTIARQLDLQWNLDIPDLALLWPPYGGAIKTSGRATGPRSRPALLGSVEVRALDAAPLAIERLTGRFDVGLGPRSGADIQFDGDGVQIRGFNLGRLTARAGGTIEAQTVDVAIDGPAGILEAQLRGGLNETAWLGELGSLRVQRPDTGEWRLREAAGLQIDTQRVAVDQACFVQQESSLCIDGALARGAPAQTDFAITALPVASFSRLLPPGLEYEGTIDGNGLVAMTDGGWNGAATLAFGAGRVLTRENGEENVMIGYENGRVQTRFDAAELHAEVHFDLRNDGVLDAQLRTPLQGEGVLDGKVRLRVENLSLVPALVPQIGRIDGRIQADLDLAGTRSAPEASGELSVDAREMVLSDFGITLRDARLDVATSDNELSFNGEAASGEGKLGLDGALRWHEGVPAGRLRLSGDGFRAIDLPEIRVDASPALTVSVDGRNIAVAGEVTVPAASISPLNIATGVGVSPDQIIVDEASAAQPRDRWRVDATLRVTAGDAVQISGFGLKGRLTGSVLIVQQPGQPVTGRGTLEIVDGRYRAYGQELAINTGRLEFTGGPLDNPGLDLRASRQAGEVEAGVQVRGALRRPNLTLYSSPPLSDTQTLSYLVTGRGVEQLDEAGQNAVSDAATRLAIQSGGSLLANSVGRGLGLDTVAFEDEGTTASTALVVGKQLSPRLFVSYGIGLFESLNTLRLRYRINPRLTLETESGVNTSADLLYSFDR